MESNSPCPSLISTTCASDGEGARGLLSGAKVVLVKEDIIELLGLAESLYNRIWHEWLRKHSHTWEIPLILVASSAVLSSELNALRRYLVMPALVDWRPSGEFSPERCETKVALLVLSR